MNKKKELDENIKTIVSFYGYLNQLDKTIEECSELIIETLKIKQYLKKYESIKDWSFKEHIIEEIADVLVMIKQLIHIFNCKKEVQAMIEYKVNRQIKRIQSEIEEDKK